MVAAAEPTLRDLLEKLDLRGTDELWEVERLAQRIQVARLKSGAAPAGSHLSRSSLMAACLLRSPRVRVALEKAKLDTGEYSLLLGLPGLKVEFFEPGPVEDRPVDPNLLAPALELYRAHFGYLPLGAPGLAWSLASRPEGGWLEERLAEAHLDFDVAQQELLDVLLAPGTDDAPRVDEAPDQHLLPIERLGSVVLSGLVHAVVTRAAETARDQGGDVLTSTLVFTAMVEAGGARPNPEHVENVSGLLWNVLYRADPESYSAALDAYLAWYREQSSSKHAAEPGIYNVAALTSYLWGAIEKALEISATVSRLHSEIHARHLLAGLLVFRPATGEDTGTHLCLERLGVPPRLVAQHLLTYLEQNAPEEEADDLEAWREILAAVQRGEARAAAGFVLARFDAEGLEGRDLLGIDEDVASFARLLAAKSLEPPLAIGLFGDWGTGKSFFIRRLRRRIDHLASLARQASQTGEGSAFFQDVVQVEFNAWHYVETNLWASLVTHVFETLNRHFTGPDGEQERWQQLLEKLDQAQQLQSDAEQVLSRAETDLARSRQSMVEKRHALSAAIRRAWSGVLAALPKDQEKLLRTNLGAAGLVDLRDQLLETRSQGRALTSRWPFFRTALFRGLGSASALGWAGGAVLIAVALAVLATYLVESTLLQQALGRIADVVGLVGGVAAWLAKAMTRAHGVMDAVEEAGRVVREELEDGPAGQDLREAEAGVAAAADEVEQRKRRLGELRAQLEELRPGRRLSSFLAERAASSDYHQHLGLAAVVRRDFEKLHELMNRRIGFRVPKEEVEPALASGRVPEAVRREMSRIDRDPLPGDQDQEKLSITREGEGWRIRDLPRKRDLDLVPSGDAFECTIDWNLPSIERIVLYIDDLDRCPASRVVEVLQAIHLLLAFPLFVVVVAVDARWVSSALDLRYRRLWDRFGETERRPGPQDYLEKIFQIPFWLEPLHAETTRDYLRGLLAGSVKEGGRSSGAKDGKQEEKARPERSAGEHAVRDDGQESVSPGREAERGETERENRTPDPPAQELSPAQGAADRQESFEELRPRSLELTREELDFIERLAPVVGRTPRAVKRFVNVYRLIRAGIEGTKLNEFLAPRDEGRDFEALAFLLAMLAGKPKIAANLFDKIATASPSQALSDQVEPGSDLHLTLQDFQKEGVPFPSVRILRRWLRLVSRYSFRIGEQAGTRLAPESAPSGTPPSPG